ncbi:unnamed protein product [Rhizopus microsporus]
MMATVKKSITNDDWLSYLQRYHIIETEEESQVRRTIIKLLEAILPSFSRAVAKEHDWKRGDIGCTLLPFGSYALGGYLRNADIDLILVCPQSVHRRDFFKLFPPLLKQQPQVTGLETVQRAAVPIIKFNIDKISVDISFVRLRIDKVMPNINFLDDSLLMDIDETCLASMDGPRVNQFCKRQINQQHVRLFQTCLQCIKHWATERGIYSKPIGYLNGSAWTLLLVKTYMSIKHQEGLTVTYILQEFFKMWSRWPWQTPVMLTNYIPDRNGGRIEYKNLTQFEGSVMPIVSPCYPVCNVAPNVTKSTKKVLQRELERGYALLTMEGVTASALIHKLFNPINYLTRYKHFINIVTSTSTINNHEAWTGRMAIYIPKYIEMIEEDPAIKEVQPLMKPYDTVVNYRTTEEKIDLQNGFTQEEARIHDNGKMNPGVIYLTYYLIGITFNTACKFIVLYLYSI